MKKFGLIILGVLLLLPSSVQATTNQTMIESYLVTQEGKVYTTKNEISDLFKEDSVTLTFTIQSKDLSTSVIKVKLSDGFIPLGEVALVNENQEVSLDELLQRGIKVGEEVTSISFPVQLTNRNAKFEETILSLDQEREEHTKAFRYIVNQMSEPSNNTYTLKFVDRGGFPFETHVVKLDQIVKTPTVYKFGYDFIEFNTKRDGSGSTYKEEPIKQNDTYIALFKPTNMKVNYYVDETLYDTQLVTFGSRLPSITSPIKEGYEFQGWSGLVSIVSQDIDVHAQFKELPAPTTSNKLQEEAKPQAPIDSPKQEIPITTEEEFMGVFELSGSEENQKILAMQERSILIGRDGEVSFQVTGNTVEKSLTRTSNNSSINEWLLIIGGIGTLLVLYFYYNKDTKNKKTLKR